MFCVFFMRRPRASVQVLRMKNLREEVPPTPVTPAKAGVQRNKVLRSSSTFISIPQKQGNIEPLRGTCCAGHLPSQV